MPEKRFLTLAELGEELNVSVSQAYALVRSGDLKAIQVGGRKQWRVERVMIEEYIAQAYRRTRDNLDQLPAEPPEDIEQ
jgi:excisionase family DNA binding protein